MTTDTKTPEERATANVDHYMRIRSRADCMKRAKRELEQALKFTEKRTKPYRRLKTLISLVELCDEDETAAWVNSWNAMEKAWVHWFKTEGWKLEDKK